MNFRPFMIVPVALAGLALIPAQAATPAPAPGPGEPLFRQRCMSCHAIEAGKVTPIAPNLRGIVGRKAASAASFRYSPALTASNLVWTRANLDRFLTNPMGTVPGTRMVVRITDPAQRAQVIDYLASQR